MTLKNKAEQIAAHLLGELKEGRLAPGSRAPTERELCERLGVSRVSVRRALADLERQGAIVRRGRAGTFMAATTPSPAPRPRIGFALHHRWVRDTFFLDIAKELELRLPEGEEPALFFHSVLRPDVYLKAEVALLFVDHNYSDAELAAATAAGVPCAPLFRRPATGNHIHFDHEAAGHELGLWLADHGHRDIAQLRHGLESPGSEFQLRRQGLERARDERGFRLPTVELMPDAESGVMDIRTAVDSLLASRRPFTALVAPDEKGVVAVQELLESQGLSACLATFGNNYAMRRLPFPLVTASFPPGTVAERLLAAAAPFLRGETSGIAETLAPVIMERRPTC